MSEISIWQLLHFSVGEVGVVSECQSHPYLTLPSIEDPYPGKHDAMARAMTQLEKGFGEMVSATPIERHGDPYHDFIVIVRHTSPIPKPSKRRSVYHRKV